jgi:hypothetical protein
MNTDTERLLIAERAAEWLIRLETATQEEREEFWNWLRESPLHVREVLAAQACHIELRRLLKNARIDTDKFLKSPGNVHTIAHGGGSHLQREVSSMNSNAFPAPLAKSAVRRIRWIVVVATLFTALMAAAAVVLYGAAHKRMTTARPSSRSRPPNDPPARHLAFFPNLLIAVSNLRTRRNNEAPRRVLMQYNKTASSPLSDRNLPGEAADARRERTV